MLVKTTNAKTIKEAITTDALIAVVDVVVVVVSNVVVENSLIWLHFISILLHLGLSQVHARASLFCVLALILPNGTFWLSKQLRLNQNFSVIFIAYSQRRA